MYKGYKDQEKRKEYIKKYSKEYRQKNKEKHKEYKKEWIKRNPDKIRKYWQKQGLKKIKVGWNKERKCKDCSNGFIPKVGVQIYCDDCKWTGRKRQLKLRFQIFQRDNFTCQYCGRKAPDIVLHIDHIYPKSKGGLNNPDNYKSACLECNVGKGDMILA